MFSPIFSFGPVESAYSFGRSAASTSSALSATTVQHTDSPLVVAAPMNAVAATGSANTFAVLETNNIYSGSLEWVSPAAASNGITLPASPTNTFIVPAVGTYLLQMTLSVNSSMANTVNISLGGAGGSSMFVPNSMAITASQMSTQTFMGVFTTTAANSAINVALSGTISTVCGVAYVMQIA